MNMNRLQNCIFVLTIFFAGVTAAEASWVRGRGNVNNVGLLDNLKVSQPSSPLAQTIAAVQFNDAQKGMFSQSDLGNGALRGRAFVTGGSASAGANPVLGETITFNNTGNASTWDFSFDLDGTVETGTNPFPIEQDFGAAGIHRTTFIQFGIHVFPGHTVGPQGSQNAWNQNLNTALFTQVRLVNGFPTTGMLENFSASIADVISGSLPVQPGINSFDVVTIMSIQGNIPSTVDSSFDFNFLNTAALTIDSPVPFTSESGVFLTGTNNIPEPATISLIGLATLAWTACRRRRTA